MIPAFTNVKRLKKYEADPKKGGFTYINWEIEDELWKFQKEIEQKFMVSGINKGFTYPRMKTVIYEDYKVNNEGGQTHFLDRQNRR